MISVVHNSGKLLICLGLFELKTWSICSIKIREKVPFHAARVGAPLKSNT